MRLEKKPQSLFECESASHGIRNSLDNSFTELSQLTNSADGFNQRISYDTSPKELQLRIFSVDNEEPVPFGSCVKTKVQDSKADYDKRVSSILDDGSKEMGNDRNRRISTEAKDLLNLSLKQNGHVKCEFILCSDCLEDRQTKHSSAVIGKNEAEKVNIEMKLKKMEIKKSEVEERNMEKKKMEKGKMEKKREEIMPFDKDVDETFLKLLVTDEGKEEDQEEKGSLEIKNTQKDTSLVTMVEKHESCGKADEKEKFEEKDYVDTADEKTTEIIEKWEDEKDEKVEKMNKYKEKAKVSQNEETRKEKIRDSPQVGEFEGNVEINWGEESQLVIQNEIKVVEIMMTSKVDYPVKPQERSSVSKATNDEPRMEEISVAGVVDCRVTIEDRSCVGKAVRYEPSKKILESVEGICFNKAEGCEEMEKSKLSKPRSSPVETTGEGDSVLCLSYCGFVETISKFQTNHNAPYPTNNSWINISSHTYKELSKAPDQGPSGVGHGDDRNRSDSAGESPGFLRSLSGKSPTYSTYSRQGSGGSGGGFGSSGGGGGGRDGGDDNWENKKHLEFTEARQKRKQDKKLKKKCRLEHGILTKEQIYFVTGWLLNRNHSVPEALNEMLKCLSICLRGRDDSIDDCKICNALLLMLKHSSACAAEVCKLCDGIVLLYASENITEQWLPSGSRSREQLKKDLRSQFAELLSSEDGTTSESDSDFASGGQSCDVIDFTNVPDSFKSSRQPGGLEPVNEQGDQEVVQGPPADSEGRINSEFLPSYGDYRSFFPQNELRYNYSLPVDARNARSGSVVYGSKELVRAMVGGWQESAEYQRSSDNPQRHRLHHRFISNRAGVILQSQADKLRIQNNNYEPEEEWNLVTERALGTGVSGSCYAGCDGQTEFTFCVKKIQLHKFYADEILIWLEMEHPDIVELYGVIVYDGFVYVIQELITGPTLKEHISERKGLNSYEALMYLQHLLELLIYLKCKNVIHNDIKADNILVREPSKSTRLVLIDFGLASHTSYVQPGIHPVGGQTHWSPEKAASEGYSFPADLWAAVAVFVHMLGGVEPWIVRFKHTRLLHCIIKQHSPPLQDVPPGLPRQVHGLILEGWTVDPSARPSASDLLKNVAFKLLDVDPSMELFMSHLSHVESIEVELPNADSILEESETEELISLAQQHLSLRQQSQQSPALTSSGLADMRLSSSTRSFFYNERPHIESALDRPAGAFPSSDRHVSLNILRPVQVMPRLEESIHEHKFESILHQLEMMEDREMYLLPTDNDDLSVTYDDLSLFGILQPPTVFCVENPSALGDIEKLTERSNTSLSKTLAKPLEQVPELHRVKLYPASSPNEAMAPVDEATGPSPSIPTVVENWLLSDDEESRSLQLYSNDAPDDVDRANIPASSLDVFHNNSVGTTLRMMLDGHQVYCIHLHPGTECSWSEVVRRASTEIHHRGVVAFTAEVVMSDQREPVDVSATIPSVPEILVETVRLSAFQDGWSWKVEDSRIIYHPNYHGHFGPEFDD